MSRTSEDPKKTDPSAAPEEEEETAGGAPLGRVPNANDAKVEAAAAEMFERLAKFMRGEIQATAQDYQLLSALHDLARDKYENMSERAVALVASAAHIEKQYEAVQPYLAEIDKLDENLSKLEEVVSHLDEYTLKLAGQFNQVYSK